MARPVGAEADKTRASILSAATRLFADHGRDGVTTRQIAERARTTTATLHHYFGDKETLYRASVDAVYSEIGLLRQVLQAKLVAGGFGPRPLEAVARMGFRFALEHTTAMRLTLRQVVETGEIPGGRRSTVQGPFLEHASQLLAAATGRAEAEVRLSLQTIVVLCARYSLSNDDELETLVPSRPTREGRVQALEDHVVRVAEALLGPSGQ
jgi:AcrR family transcriptional regulator